MGLLRLLFAIAVVIFHSHPLFGYESIGGTLAVHSFFIISGFYMALILNEKYTGKHSYKLFITNRFLRIYPLYWTILGITVFVAFLNFFANPQNPLAMIHLVVSAVSHPSIFATIGSLANHILRNITLIVTPDYFTQNFTSTASLWVQPAWSLQVELLFYLIAPFIVLMRIKALSLLTLIFLIIPPFLIYPNHLNDTSITYIFLEKLIFFLVGILSYKTYKILKNKPIKNILLLFIFIAILLFTFWYRPVANLDWIYYVALSLSIPFVFMLTNANPIDRFLGNLSYPIYISHMLVIKLLSRILSDTNSLFMLSLFPILLFVSFLLWKYVDKPIDRYRQRRLH